MKIQCLTTFLDGRDRFEKDDERTVDDERAAYFIANGWAVELGTDAVAPQSSGAVDLDIHNSAIGLEDNHG